MTIIESYLKPSKRWGMKRPHRCLLLKCDTCDKIWETTAYAYASKRKFHSCSRKCCAVQRRRGGRVHQAHVKACINRYGVENSSQSNEIRKKIEDTCYKRFGKSHAFQSSEVKSKIRQTMCTRYGVEHPMKVDRFKSDVKMTCLQRYGGQTMSSPQLRDKAQRTMLNRYGVKHPLQSSEILERYPWKQRALKSHLTMKARGTYKKQASIAENDFYVILCEHFGSKDVIRHVQVNGWSIDFYIRSADTYIQFDGVYWHGLDRPIDMIRESNVPRDKTIYKTWLRDREQDKWFIENNLRITRVTDQYIVRDVLNHLMEDEQR